MNFDLAIAHYHLNRGGVAQVVNNHLESLAANAAEFRPRRIAIVYGGRARQWELTSAAETLGVQTHVVRSLDYSDQCAGADQSLESDLRTLLQSIAFEPATTILHIHNHSLGKNAFLPGAIRHLAESGYRTLLQIHDFAEDFRPLNYSFLRQHLSREAEDRGNPAELTGDLYPQAEHIHYTVLNGRDKKILQLAGIDTRRTTLLPNPVVVDGKPDPTAVESNEAQQATREKLLKLRGIRTDLQLLLYPVRGIRRKNVGEAILWSAALLNKAQIGFTLPPMQPKEAKAYERWKELAQSLKLDCHFELGTIDELTFPEIVASADRILTTSVAEGFGLVFLECWLHGKMLIGRDLPEITGDFKAVGIDLDHLRPRIEIPVDWMDFDAVILKTLEAYSITVSGYQLPVPDRKAIESIIQSTIRDGTIDFAILPGAVQQQVVSQVALNESSRADLLSLNPTFEDSIRSLPETDQLIESNARLVNEHFSVRRIGQQLSEIYDHLMHAKTAKSVEPLENAGVILNSLTGLERFHPIRVES